MVTFIFHVIAPHVCMTLLVLFQRHALPIRIKRNASKMLHCTVVKKTHWMNKNTLIICATSCSLESSSFGRSSMFDWITTCATRNGHALPWTATCNIFTMYAVINSFVMLSVLVFV